MVQAVSARQGPEADASDPTPVLALARSDLEPVRLPLILLFQRLGDFYLSRGEWLVLVAAIHLVTVPLSPPPMTLAHQAPTGGQWGGARQCR